MAYAPYEEDEDENLSPVAQPSGAGLSSAGNYGPTQVNNPSGPGKFINFSSYFNANSGAAQGMGSQLADRLEGGASSALSGAKKTEADTTTSAAANTLAGPAAGVTVANPALVPTVTAPEPKPTRGPVLDDRSKPRPVKDRTAAPPPPTYAQPVNTITPEEAAAKGGTIYKGPTAAGVNAAYDPLQSRADVTGRELAQTSDAAGVKAVQGGTGFDAQLAYVAGGNRLSGLRQKYGGISKAVSDSKNLALAAANNATDTTAASVGAYQGLGKTFSDAETERKRVETETATKKSQDGWNSVIDASNGRGWGAHIVTTGERPTGEAFVSTIPPEYPLAKMDRATAARVFDAMSDEEAKAALRHPMLGGSGNWDAFNEYLNQMARKYGVQ